MRQEHLGKTDRARVIRRLIDEYGTGVLHSNSGNGVPLLCDAIGHQQLHSARLLLESASEHHPFVNVDVNRGECPILDWAMKTRSVDVAKFVLDSLAEKRLSVEESCAILTNYLIPLIEMFPDLMADYLENDRFTFEYGRFTVPYSLFEKNGKCPITMTTDEALGDWTMPDSVATRELWIRNSEDHATEMTKTSNLHVDAVAKFLCVDLNNVRYSSSADNANLLSKLEKWSCRHENLLWQLGASNLPIGVFRSESLRAASNWIFYSHYSRFLCLLILDILTAFLFSLFTLIYGLRQGKHDRWERQISFSIIGTTFFVSLIQLAIRRSKIKWVIHQHWSVEDPTVVQCRFLSVVVTLLLLVHVIQSSEQSQYSAFLTSVECILCWILVTHSLSLMTS